VVLNKREKSIAIALGVIVALVVLYSFAIEPYFTARTQAQENLDTADRGLKQASSLFQREKRLRPVWTQMTENGLTATPSDAQAQLLNSLNTWVQESGISLSSMHPDRPAPEKEKQFIRVGVKLSGSGPMSAVAKLMFRLETAKIPLNVEDMQVNQRKDGTDDLQITVSLSTLCLASPDNSKPAAKQPPGRSVADARGERQ
jgi:type II secretory pathway component PulM